LLGSLQPTSLLVLDRNRQRFGNRCHDVDYDNTTCQPQRVSRRRIAQVAVCLGIGSGDRRLRTARWGHCLTGHVRANSDLDPPEYALPMSSSILPEQPHCRILAARRAE
jgi:hypothetical protein